jgi:hypothetical protein
MKKERGERETERGERKDIEDRVGEIEVREKGSRTDAPPTYHNLN